MTQAADQVQQIDDAQIVEVLGKLYLAKFFIYLANFTFVGAGAVRLAQSITIDSDADFQLLYLTGSAQNAAGADVSARFTIDISEGSAGGLAWMSAPVNLQNLVGTGQLPFPIGLIPQLLPKKRVYNIGLTNGSGAAATGQICFVGYKLYPAEQSQALGALLGQ